MKAIDILRAVIAEKSATTAGFEIGRDAVGHSGKSAQYECGRQMVNGLLHRAKLNHTHAAYFSTEAARNAFLARRADEVIAPGAKAIHITRRKPEPVRLQKTATVIYPNGYKHTIHLMPPARFQAVSLPGVHYGMGQMR